MSKVPDAWDDDWVRSADTTKPAAPLPSKPLTRTERRIQHTEANRKLWTAAETPERSYYLETKTDVPLQTDFKPAVKVLSRKPSPQVANGRTDDGDESEDEARRRAEANLAERTRRAAIEREEKQRKYAEARERIMGTSGGGNEEKGTSRSNSRQSSRRGRTSGPGVGGRGSPVTVVSAAEQSPARGGGQGQKLFDPGYSSPKPMELRTGGSGRGSGSREEVMPIRMPRGPDGSGRGGFAPRGGRGG